jgi:nucleotide-binding universal stress UspA family protein
LAGRKVREIMRKRFDPGSVVCALDVRDPREALLDTATSIAARFDAHLHLLHVWDAWAAQATDGDEVLGDGAHRLATWLTDAAEAARTRYDRVTTSLVPGNAWEQILLFAETHSCDLIITGTHGRTGLARWFNQSVAERVVRTTHVPVLVVPMIYPMGPVATMGFPDATRLSA